MTDIADIAVSLALMPYDKNVRNYKTFAKANGKFEDIPNFICTKVWSPIVWKNGQRAKENFVSSSVVAVDIDEGKTIDETAAELTDYGLSFHIATTKSHQKPKTTDSGVNKPACDRYRVLIATAGTVDNRELYTYNAIQAIDLLGGDLSGGDGARYFFPCVDVVRSVVGKNLLPWQPLPHDYVPEAQRHLERRERLGRDGAVGLLPAWILSILEGNVGAERHKTCYSIGCTLAAMGMNEAQITKMIQALNRTPMRDITLPDIERAVWNGVHRELGTQAEQRS